jgi:hypothetical protein
MVEARSLSETVGDAGENASSHFLRGRLLSAVYFIVYRDIDKINQNSREEGLILPVSSNDARFVMRTGKHCFNSVVFVSAIEVCRRCVSRLIQIPCLWASSGDSIV